MWFAVKFTDTPNYIFQAKNCSYNNSTVKWKSWKHQKWFMFFKFSGSWKTKCTFYSSNIVCQQFWSSEKNCLELKLWMSSFLYIRSSRPKVSCKKVLLKILQNSWNNIRDAAINLIKFQAKDFIEKRLSVCDFPRILQMF